jgi:hypothetical protein
MPQVKRSDSPSLRYLINHVTSHMNALQALSLNTSRHDLILNHLLLSVLDAETHREWELRTSKFQDIFPVTELVDFLEDKCKALELLQTNQPTGTTPSRHVHSSSTKVSHLPLCNLATQVQERT